MKLDNLHEWVRDENLEKFTRMRKRGESFDNIASELGFTRKELDRKIKEYWEGKKNRLIELYNSKATKEQMMQEMGYTETTLKSTLRDLVNKGLIKRIRAPRWTQEEIDELISLRKEGLKVPAIATKMGKNRERIKGKLKELIASGAVENRQPKK